MTVVSGRVHAAEQNAETRKMVLNGKYTHLPRTLRHRDVIEDGRSVSHDGEEHKIQDTQLRQGWHLCATSAHMYYKYGLTNKHFPTERRREGN